MKRRSIFTALSLVTFSLLTISSCGESGGIEQNSSNDINNSNEVTKKAPVYQGMTVSRNNISKASKKFKDNVEEDDDDLDDEFNDDDLDELDDDIDDLVKIEVKTDDEVKYYVNPGEVFNIEIHLSNPNDFEIQSFTLNGKKYANYMFEEGSNMELLILKTTAPATSGYIEYSIDAIKYIEGEDIKDVDMSKGDKTVKAGIKYEEKPSVTVTSKVIKHDSIKVDFEVVDTNKIVDEDNLYCYISDGKKILEKKAIKVGNNTVEFKNLLLSTTYEYGVLTAFDLIDGQDLHSEWLFKEKVKTLEGIKFNKLNASKTSVAFDFDIKYENAKIDNIKLYDFDTKELVKEVEGTVRSIDSLLSGHNYYIEANYSYKIGETTYNNSAKSQKITTLSKTAPTVEIKSIKGSKTEVNYEITIVDEDKTDAKIDSVDILKDNKVVKSNKSKLIDKFTELLSNTKYIVRVNYSYDLGEGNARVTKTISKSVTTSKKVIPSIEFGNVEVSGNSVTYLLNTIDFDSTLTIKSVQLLKEDGTVIKEVEDGLVNGQFTEVTSGTYKLKCNYEVDMNDGTEVKVKSLNSSNVVVL